MQMVRYYHIGMKFVCRPFIVIQSREHESSPAVMAKERLAAHRLGRDEVDELVGPNLFPRWTHPIPPGAKAHLLKTCQRTG